MKLVGTLSYQPRVVAPSRPARESGWPIDKAPPLGGAAILRPVGGLPFLAQYLAQESTGGADTSQRWRERDTGYRIAANPGEPARLTIDI